MSASAYDKPTRASPGAPHLPTDIPREELKQINEYFDYVYDRYRPEEEEFECVEADDKAKGFFSGNMAGGLKKMGMGMGSFGRSKSGSGLFSSGGSGSDGKPGSPFGGSKPKAGAQPGEQWGAGPKQVKMAMDTGAFRMAPKGETAKDVPVYQNRNVIDVKAALPGGKVGAKHNVSINVGNDSEMQPVPEGGILMSWSEDQHGMIMRGRGRSPFASSPSVSSSADENSGYGTSSSSSAYPDRGGERGRRNSGSWLIPPELRAKAAGGDKRPVLKTRAPVYYAKSGRPDTEAEKEAKKGSINQGYGYHDDNNFDNLNHDSSTIDKIQSVVNSINDVVYQADSPYRLNDRQGNEEKRVQFARMSEGQHRSPSPDGKERKIRLKEGVEPGDKGDYLRVASRDRSRKYSPPYKKWSDHARAREPNFKFELVTDENPIRNIPKIRVNYPETRPYKGEDVTRFWHDVLQGSGARDNFLSNVTFQQPPGAPLIELERDRTICGICGKKGTNFALVQPCYHRFCLHCILDWADHIGAWTKMLSKTLDPGMPSRVFFGQLADVDTGNLRTKQWCPVCRVHMKKIVVLNYINEWMDLERMNPEDWTSGQGYTPYPVKLPEPPREKVYIKYPRFTDATKRCQYWFEQQSGPVMQYLEKDAAEKAERQRKKKLEAIERKKRMKAGAPGNEAKGMRG